MRTVLMLATLQPPQKSGKLSYLSIPIFTLLPLWTCSGFHGRWLTESPINYSCDNKHNSDSEIVAPGWQTQRPDVHSKRAEQQQTHR